MREKPQSLLILEKNAAASQNRGIKKVNFQDGKKIIIQIFSLRNSSFANKPGKKSEKDLCMFQLRNDVMSLIGSS